MKAGDYCSHHVCECGERIKCSFDKPWFRRDEPCPKCGSDAYSWELKTERWISLSVWYKPSTWGKGYWEARL